MPLEQTIIRRVSSQLTYFGTDDDVRLGDRVEFKTLILRRKRPGTVVCMPEKTALQLNAEKKPPEDWLIKFDDGTYTGWMYHPEEMPPHPRLRLIARGSDFEAISNEELERLDNEIAGESAGSLSDLIGCAIIVLFGAGLVVLLRIVF